MNISRRQAWGNRRIESAYRVIIRCPQTHKPETTMFKSLALFAVVYFIYVTGLHFMISTATIATHFHWCYPLVALCTTNAVRPPRPLAFSLLALPLVYLFSFARFVGETVWYLGFDTLRQMHGTMLPMMLAQLRENLSAQDVVLMLANVAAVFLALYLPARWSAKR